MTTTITSTPVVSLLINASTPVRPRLSYLDVIAHEGRSFLGCFMPTTIDLALVKRIFGDEQHVTVVRHEHTYQIRLRPKSDFKPPMSSAMHKAIYENQIAHLSPVKLAA